MSGVTAVATISPRVRKGLRPLESHGLTTSVSPMFSMRMARLDSQVCRMGFHEPCGVRQSRHPWCRPGGRRRCGRGTVSPPQRAAGDISRVSVDAPGREALSSGRSGLRHRCPPALQPPSELHRGQRPDRGVDLVSDDDANGERDGTAVEAQPAPAKHARLRRPPDGRTADSAGSCPRRGSPACTPQGEAATTRSADGWPRSARAATAPAAGAVSPRVVRLPGLRRAGRSHRLGRSAFPRGRRCRRPRRRRRCSGSRRGTCRVAACRRPDTTTGRTRR